MKTVVSLSDELFRLAETAARRLRVSRSQLYATALSEFLNRQQGKAVTERLNEVYFPQGGETEFRPASRPTEIYPERLFNRGRLQTAISAVITSNVELARVLPPRVQRSVDEGLRTVL